jgi:hypothetical protein
MTILRWLSLLAAGSALVAVIRGTVRGFRTSDPLALRRSARRFGWGVAGAFALAIAVYSIGAVASFGTVADARPEDKATVLAAGLEEPAAYLRWCIGLLITAGLGITVLRFRAGYLSTDSNGDKLPQVRRP